MTVVRNMGLLKRMAKKGLITFHQDTGKKVGVMFSNHKHTAYYIESYLARHFKFNGKDYYVEYVDGCFCPFVFSK